MKAVPGAESASVAHLFDSQVLAQPPANELELVGLNVAIALFVEELERLLQICDRLLFDVSILQHVSNTS